jgi:hypothetical protein
MMSSPEIEEFAKLLVQRVRDQAVSQSEILLRPSGEAVARAIPDVVDGVVLQLLRAIDEGRLHLVFVAGNGREVDLTSEGKGKLASQYAGEAGWRSRYT